MRRVAATEARRGRRLAGRQRGIELRLLGCSVQGSRTVNVLPLPSSLSSEISPPKQLAQLLDDRQAQPGAGVLAGHGVAAGSTAVALAELLEDGCLVFLGDAHAGVGHLQHQVVSLGRGWRVTVIRPPSGVNLMALDSRLLRICCTLAWSWYMSGRSRLDLGIPGRCSSRSVSGRAMSHWAAITGSMRKSVEPDLHLAAFDLGQIEDVVDHVQQHPARLLDVLARSASACRRATSIEPSTSLKPRMLLSGVRSSWLMVARKSLFRRFISYSRMLTWASSSTLPSRSAFTCRSSSCVGDQVPQHAVEGHGQLLELVARVDLGPQRDVAVADRVADVAQVLQRLDDHVAHDRRRRRPSPETR